MANIHSDAPPKHLMPPGLHQPRTVGLIHTSLAVFYGVVFVSVLHRQFQSQMWLQHIG